MRVVLRESVVIAVVAVAVVVTGGGGGGATWFTISTSFDGGDSMVVSIALIPVTGAVVSVLPLSLLLWSLLYSAPPRDTASIQYGWLFTRFVQNGCRDFDDTREVVDDDDGTRNNESLGIVTVA